MFASRHRLVPRIGRVPRLCAAAICAALALASALGARRDTAGDRTAPVVVAARDLPAGQLLTARDLVVARLPGRLRPAATRGDPGALVGQRLAGPVQAREPITAVRLAGRGLTAGLAPGLLAVPIGLDDAQSSGLARPGDRVDLLATPRPDQGTAPPPSEVTTVAHRALVLAVLPGVAATPGDGLGSADGGGVELVVAVDRETAIRITRDRPAQMFTALVASP